MTWRLGKVSVSTSRATASTWRISTISAGVASTTWRVSSIGVVTSVAPPTTWRLAKVGVAITGGWRLANVSVLTAVASTPQVTPLANATIDPVMPYAVIATVSNGLTPDTWTWHLGTTSGGSQLDSLLSVSGPLASFNPPGSLVSTTLYLTVTAAKGGNTSAAQTATLTVTPTPYRYLGADGQLHAMGLPYYLKG